MGDRTACVPELVCCDVGSKAACLFELLCCRGPTGPCCTAGLGESAQGLSCYRQSEKVEVIIALRRHAHWVLLHLLLQRLQRDKDARKCGP